LLKARSALLQLTKLQHDTPLTADVERVVTGAHEFAEIRLLDALRAGRVQLPDDVFDEAERLLGAHGATVDARLGSVVDHRTAALDALTEWQRIAENPRSSRQLVHTARVIVRTCEGILADITIGQPV
jgi:hypothetical protein